EAFTPVAQEGTSERRCFLIDGWPFAADKYVTGVDARPGNRAVVQGVAVQTVGAGDVPGLRAREGVDGRPGFDCRDVGDDLWLGGGVGSWTPGQPPFESADATTGVPVPAHAQLMLQVLYDLGNAVTMPDQTEIDLQIADTVRHSLGSLVVSPTTAAAI